ncbi:hypothetical protein Aph01nite_05910 [Acrocarpospora phusangensis]|uniref:Uncharacterized protein n=1 Tax=Acrocarpospora phusangensis TaxID=1070424 RepID=A0A919Q635_9ACTN|nr:hypothetical protein Aph01nite_05910 [Acrocarpospora phusangensis]
MVDGDGPGMGGEEPVDGGAAGRGVESGDQDDRGGHGYLPSEMKTVVIIMTHLPHEEALGRGDDPESAESQVLAKKHPYRPARHIRSHERR